ncbi:MAG: hypothetical protein M1829_000036 [Trizodia sp. TS-e1964]|nr:MAG: hypothetical protein M1829_000036 [Trizodia sp. TS-e1964]
MADYIAKIVAIGESSTGKSSLTIRLCEGRFSEHREVTIGVEFGTRIVPVGPPHHTTSTLSNLSCFPPPSSLTPPPKQRFMKLSLWDTAGQETYKSLTRSYFRGASGALLVYDITRRATFLAVTDWLHDLRQIADANVVVVLVGNKADLVADGSAARQVSVHEAEEWCRINNVLRFIETSAKSGTGVETAFCEVAERIYQNIEAGKYDLKDRRSGVKGAAVARASDQTVDLAAGRGQRGGSACC